MRVDIVIEFKQPTMERKQDFIIYESNVEEYSIRFWKIFKNYLFLYLLILLILFYYDIKNRSLITESVIFLVAIFMAVRFFDVRKWVRTKIEKIELKSEIYEFQIIEKNTKTKINIPEKNLTNKLKWIGNRPKILALKIINIESESFTVYSCGKSEIVYELENITYKLNKKATQ